MMVNMLQAHNTQLQVQNKQLRAQNEDLLAQSDELQERSKLGEREWQSIRATLGWKILAGYWRCVELLVPPGTDKKAPVR